MEQKHLSKRQLVENYLKKYPELFTDEEKRAVLFFTNMDNNNYYIEMISSETKQ